MFLINFSTIPNLLLPTFSEPPCRIGMGDFCVKKEEALLLPLKNYRPRATWRRGWVGRCC